MKVNDGVEGEVGRDRHDKRCWKEKEEQEQEQEQGMGVEAEGKKGKKQNERSDAFTASKTKYTNWWRTSSSTWRRK